ncbi:hypothetical protein [Sandaracinus amylolyticus]|uniref:terminase small subunit-like protein n=1 Tax=Sandaracinus amylolyticus TaxID=927083 RepID=UPI001F386888|nr:hypothetical protein [Sandaracinus amylolyticus]UJR78920.1 Hypothetical protein I5071_9530 [Sandaracinus amylolyticus]
MVRRRPGHTTRNGGNELGTGGREKLTPEVVDRICELIAQGMPRVSACYANDVSDMALRYARQRDPEIDEKASKAEAAGAEFYRQKIMEAADSGKAKDWRAYESLAKSLHPKVYVEPAKRIEMSGPDGESLAPQVHIIGDPVRIARVDVQQLEAAARGELLALSSGDDVLEGVEDYEDE